VGPFLVDLRNKFQEIAGDDQLIDRNEFRKGLEISNEGISNRLFDIFDRDNNGSIDFEEFMATIETIISGTNQDKIKFAFNLHDLDDSGFIDRPELKILIEQSFLENNLDYDEFQLDLLVDEFFKRADKDKSGTIDFNEFLDVADAFPDFLNGFAVNPVSWLVSDRYDKAKQDIRDDSKPLIQNQIQVQDIGILQWLLIPRLIFLYNVLINRKKNREFVDLKAIHLLPSKILELTISRPDGFIFNPGDYLYVNCQEISRMEWYPFNIIHYTNSGDLTLHIKSNNKWTRKLYREILEGLQNREDINWSIRIDGPYGSSSNNIMNTEHAILVGAGHGISRIAPILQDIALKSKEDKDQLSLKRIDLYWLNNDEHYFEWFTKLLDEINFKNDDSFFRYHIFFVDKNPEEMKERMIYISTDILKKETDVKLVDNLWVNSSFGIPNWKDELKNICSVGENVDSKLFFSGPRKLRGNLIEECKKLNIVYNEGDF